MRIAAVAVVFFATFASAAIVPFDFTGHWTGTADPGGQGDHGAELDVTLTGVGTFDGSMTVNTGQIRHCTLHGRQRRRVVVTFQCEEGGHGKFVTALDQTAETLTGRFTFVPPPAEDKRTMHGLVILMKDIAGE